jgi:hypothetical protein
MEAAKEGHELIVNTILTFGAQVNKVSRYGDTARSLGFQHGHMMVVSLIDNFLHRERKSSLRSEADLDDNSSEDEFTYQSNSPQPDDWLGVRSHHLSSQEVDIRAGPLAFNQLIRRQEGDALSSRQQAMSARQSMSSVSNSQHAASQGKLYFNYPIPCHEPSHHNFEDLMSDGSSYNSSIESASAQSSDSEASQINEAFTNPGLEDYEEDDRNTYSFPAGNKSFNRKQEMKKQREVSRHQVTRRSSSGSPDSGEGQGVDLAGYDVGKFLEEVGVEKYVELFEENGIDLRTLLTMTDGDLKEIGLKLFGPRRKVTAAIARWHVQIKRFSSKLEQTYADKLEVENQELEIKYKQATAEIEQLKSQVSQEQNLRGVAETVLLEERTEKQQLVEDYLKAKALCKEARILVCPSAHQEGLNGSTNNLADDSVRDALAVCLQRLDDTLSNTHTKP